MMRTDDGITTGERAALREALGIDDARIDQAVAWAMRAGYERYEVAGVILDAAARPEDGKPGAKPTDALRAAIFVGSPRDAGRAERFLCASMARAGVFGADAPSDWTDLASRRRPRSAHEVAMECLADAVDPTALEAGQQGFAGWSWRLPESESDDEPADIDETDEALAGEPA